MRIPRWGVCLLGVGCGGFVGCSQTGFLRPNGPADMKTVASVNEQAGVHGRGPAGLGVIAARGGRRSRTAAAAGTRISGRVFDDEGRAVPNAQGAAGRRRIGRWQGQLRHDRSIGGLHPPRAAARVELHPGRRISGMRRHDVGAGAGPGARIRRPHRAGGPRPRARVRAAQLEDASGPHAVQLVPRRRDRRVPGDGQATGAGCR